MNVQLSHVLQLCLRQCSGGISLPEGLKMIVKTFPNLTKLWIDDEITGVIWLNEVIHIFADGLFKLEHLYLNGFREHLKQFNAEPYDLQKWISVQIYMTCPQTPQCL